MRALQLVGPRSFAGVEVATPSLNGAGYPAILVRTHWVAVCGSDIPTFAGHQRPAEYPLPVGAPMHECLGQVVESASESFRRGEYVIALPEGERGLVEYFVARADKAVGLPPELAADETSPLIQPLATVLNAVDRLPAIEGRSVAVIGLGFIGLLFCWLLRRRGARRVIGIDPGEHRCRVAATLGTAQTWPLRGVDVVQAMQHAPEDWEAPDMVIEAVGHQTETVNDCLALVRPRGTVLAFGVPGQSVYPIEYELFFRKNVNLIASVTPDWSVYLPRARDLFLECRRELKPLVTHRLPIREAEVAYTLYERHEGDIVKAVLDASCWGTPDSTCSP